MTISTPLLQNLDMLSLPVGQNVPLPMFHYSLLREFFSYQLILYYIPTDNSPPTTVVTKLSFNPSLAAAILAS